MASKTIPSPSAPVTIQAPTITVKASTVQIPPPSKSFPKSHDVFDYVSGGVAIFGLCLAVRSHWLANKVAEQSRIDKEPKLLVKINHEEGPFIDGRHNFAKSIWWIEALNVGYVPVTFREWVFVVETTGLLLRFPDHQIVGNDGTQLFGYKLEPGNAFGIRVSEADVIRLMQHYNVDGRIKLQPQFITMIYSPFTADAKWQDIRGFTDQNVS